MLLYFFFVNFQIVYSLLLSVCVFFHWTSVNSRIIGEDRCQYSFLPFSPTSRSITVHLSIIDLPIQHFTIKRHFLGNYWTEFTSTQSQWFNSVKEFLVFEHQSQTPNLCGVILIKPYRKLHSEAVARRYSEKKVF